MKQWFDQKNAPEQGHVLCRSNEIEIGSVKEFEFGESIKTRFRMFVYRSENDVPVSYTHLTLPTTPYV